MKLGEDLTLEVPASRTPKTIPEKVKMGIRPQYLEIGDIDGLPFQVYTIEPTGRDDVIICENNGSMFTGLATPGHNIKEGENVKVAFDMGKVQLFDADTEKSILWN